MITANKSIDQLIEGVLDNGLPFIGKYLEKKLQHSILIADHQGKILFPEPDYQISGKGSMSLNISAQMGYNEYCYLEEESSLYYCVEANQKNAFVVVREVKMEMIPPIIAILRETRLPVKCYFSKLSNYNARFEKELAEYLFGQNHASLRDILALYDAEMDLQRPYFALLLQAEEDWIKAESAELCSCLGKYVKQEKLRAITVCHQNQLVLIIPADVREGGAGNDLIDSSLDVSAFKYAIESRFKRTIAIGAGRVLALTDLDKSITEARIVIILSQLLGQNNLMQKFSDLGIYQFIFSQESRYIYEYCNQRLGKLIEHDSKNDGELLPTLRKLLDACVNIKATADRLYIHVNTLYYRINKIEQILNIDLARMDTRVELYTAIKVWDTLQILTRGKELFISDPATSLPLI